MADILDVMEDDLVEDEAPAMAEVTVSDISGCLRKDGCYQFRLR